jgi:hypothetical protein
VVAASTDWATIVGDVFAAIAAGASLAAVIVATRALRYARATAGDEAKVVEKLGEVNKDTTETAKQLSAVLEATNVSTGHLADVVDATKNEARARQRAQLARIDELVGSLNAIAEEEPPPTFRQDRLRRYNEVRLRLGAALDVLRGLDGGDLVTCRTIADMPGLVEDKAFVEKALEEIRDAIAAA